MRELDSAIGTCSTDGTAYARNGACEDAEEGRGSQGWTAHHTRSRVDQRWRQQEVITGQNVLTSGPGNIGKFQDMDGTSKQISPDDNRLITLLRVLDMSREYLLTTWCQNRRRGR